MTTVGVIPARYASTRFPGKALAPLGGYPMVHHVYSAAMQAKSLDQVIIATESRRVATDLERLGDHVVMTAQDHRSGSDRVAEAVQHIDADIVVNIQGDEPQLQPEIIDQLVRRMESDPSIRMGTVASRQIDDADLLNPNVVKVAVADSQAVAFFRDAPNPMPAGEIFRHIGIYAFRADYLREFAAQPQSADEIALSLEQLRAADMNVTLSVVVTDFASVGVDTREDLQKLAADWRNPDWIEAL